MSSNICDAFVVMYVTTNMMICFHISEKVNAMKSKWYDKKVNAMKSKRYDKKVMLWK